MRSAAIGVWLTRGSRHEDLVDAGMAHFVEHMLFKGTTSRSARDLAQAIDSIGGQVDAFTSKEYAGYYIKVLDDQLPVALDLLSDMLLRPAFAPDDVVREQGVVLEEIKMVEDTPDDLVHEVFAQSFWEGHPLGRPILGTESSVSAFTADRVRAYFGRTYTAANLIVTAAGRLDHAIVRDQVANAFAAVPHGTPDALVDVRPMPRAIHLQREKDIEQSHVCLGTPAYAQGDQRRHAALVLNTVLGGSISSRLFQHIREDRGLAYSVYSNVASYSDAGMLSIYAGCAADKIADVVDVSLDELRTLRDVAVEADELRRAKDHLKGSLMLGLENTSSRMSHLARQEMVFGRQFTFDELLAAVEAVTSDDVRAVAADWFGHGAVSASIVGPEGAPALSASRLSLE